MIIKLLARLTRWRHKNAGLEDVVNDFLNSDSYLFRAIAYEIERQEGIR